MRIAVLGGGCIGLTTALQLQEELCNVRLDILAESFDHTTSHVAAGIFRVGSSYSGPDENITRKWILDSYNFYDEIRKSRDARDAGISNISGYMFSNVSPESVQNEWMAKLSPIYRRVSDSELNLVGGTWKYGSFMTTILTQPNYYLSWAKNKLTKSGAVFIEKKVNSLTEFVQDYDIIMNCTGLGAKVLCQDKKLIPVKGQVTKVRAPWLKMFFYGELNTYIIPGADGLTTLGGNRELEASDLDLCPYVSAAIQNRCEKLIPSLRTTKVVEHKSGLRPYREGGVRVEAQRIKHGLKNSIVIHNYGHGGYGICTAPGTSKYAVELAKDAHRSSAKL